MTLSNFSCLIGTETISPFDDALVLLHKIDMIGGSKNPIMKIHAFHKPISNSGMRDTISSSYLDIWITIHRCVLLRYLR